VLIDLHFHALPGIDDGPRQLDDALALLRAATADGTRTVVATPHCSRRWPNGPETVADGVAALDAAARREGIDVELLGGAEVTHEMALQLPDETLRELTLGESRCLLLESPLGQFIDASFETCVAQLQERGYRVLLAHPERAPGFRDDPSRLRALVDGGALVSITAAALSGGFGENARWSGLELLREGLVHSVDSDAHHATGRPPGMRAGIAAAATLLPALEERADWLTTAVPAALLSDAPLPPAPA